MSPTELYHWQNELERELITKPDQSFDYFKAKWNDVAPIDRSQVRLVVERMCNKKIDDTYVDSMPKTREEIEIRRTVCLLIKNFIKKEMEGKPDLEILKRGAKVSAKDIAVVYKIMHEIEYSSNSLPSIARILRATWDLPDTETIDTYFDNRRELAIAFEKFRKKVMTLTFPKE